jgi:hypothetical protein
MNLTVTSNTNTNISQKSLTHSSTSFKGYAHINFSCEQKSNLWGQYFIDYFKDMGIDVGVRYVDKNFKPCGLRNFFTNEYVILGKGSNKREIAKTQKENNKQVDIILEQLGIRKYFHKLPDGKPKTIEIFTSDPYDEDFFDKASNLIK